MKGEITLVFSPPALDNENFLDDDDKKKILKLINDLMGFLGEDRKASISRELSKIYQENIRGTLKELYDKLENINIKGEFVIVIDGKKK